MRLHACNICISIGFVAFEFASAVHLEDLAEGFRPPKQIHGDAWTDEGVAPVIGIMVQPALHHKKQDRDLLKHGSMYLPASYVKFVEAGGARVCPVLYNSTEDELDRLYRQLNGLLIPGGHCGYHKGSDYGKVVNKMLDRAKESNDAGDVFPVHGTCQGFEQIAQWAAHSDTDILTEVDAEGIALPLLPVARDDEDFPPSWSRYLGNAPDDARRGMKERSTANLHTHGIPLEQFDKGGLLDNDILRAVAKGKDRNGKEFVAHYEGKKLPFFGTQWHPEKNAFEFTPPNSLHDEWAIALSSWISRRFVGLAKKSKHEWKEGSFKLIRDFSPVSGHGEDPGFESVYYWGEKVDKEDGPAHDKDEGAKKEKGEKIEKLDS